MASSSSSSSLAKYPYPSEVNIKEFVFVKLSSKNYFMWKPMMIRVVKTRGLLGFIDGTVPRPPERMGVPDGSSTNGTTKEVENPDYEAWQRSDELLQRWILRTLEQDVLELVVHLKTAEEMWEMLQKIFSQDLPPNFEILNKETEKDLSPYLPLHKAALTGDWKRAKKIFDENPKAVRAIITGASETALMIAARSSKGEQFVKEIIEFLEPEDLAKSNLYGYTALHIAAVVGNIEVAKLLVDKNPDMPNRWDGHMLLPLCQAAENGHKEMVRYLLKVTKEEAVPNPFEGKNGAELVKSLIDTGLYDIALDLVKRYPKLARVSEPSPLELMAMKRSAFQSGTRLLFWQRLIYTWVPLDLEDSAHNRSGGDIENLTQSNQISAPQIIKNIRDKKIIHHQALRLVKHLCMEVARLKSSEAFSLFEPCLKNATCSGIHEVVEEIFESYPSAVYIRSDLNQAVLHLAIKHRRENIFNLIYQFHEGLRQIMFTMTDGYLNTGLHLAGCLENEQTHHLRANAAGAALQMQRELQWFKEVEKHTLPQVKEYTNTQGKTPAMLFTETHEDLVKEGEKWMKDTANSCTIVATLIVTIVFAAAITVPGGNNGNSGHPIFSKQKTFILFAISDALALFSSASSVLMFLSILTSRYGEYDFLYTLPKRLIIGLVTLFLSIISMMIAFGSTLLLVFGDKKEWILIPVAALSCIPVGLFASLQFPLLLDMIKSTYGRGMFGKQSDRLLH